jgi:hypothetical protein
VGFSNKIKENSLREGGRWSRRWVNFQQWREREVRERGRWSTDWLKLPSMWSSSREGGRWSIGCLKL